ncbi:MAG: hypothetical protein IPH20_27445 [Bacteroidales bacterium]|nr:hypothetical protein [Bacteroidales bacterium]
MVRREREKGRKGRERREKGRKGEREKERRGEGEREIGKLQPVGKQALEFAPNWRKEVSCSLLQDVGSQSGRQLS